MPRPPTTEQLIDIAGSFGLHLEGEELSSFHALVAATLKSHERLDELWEPSLPVRYPRTGGRRPEPGENPLNAWYQLCSIRGAPGESLSGRRVAVKDNVCVAGVPMMNGTSVLEGYTPEFDAPVVERVLAAGGEVAGKAVCEHLCFSGGSHTSDTGPVLNPNDHTRSAGGSSSGSAALVAAGEVEMAIGGDQGGSITIPAAWCGVCGLKPTYGLVPYTGIFPIEHTLDHTGPIAATVYDVALLLEATAGEDGLDPRQSGVWVGEYVRDLEGGVQDLKIGVLREGFGWPGLSERDVEESVWEAARALGSFGAEVEEVSVPMHRDGIHIWNGIAVEGSTETVMRSNALGTNHKGHYATSLLDAFARGRLTRADDLAETVKLTMLAGEHLRRSYHGRYYAKAQNLARRLNAAYDEVLERLDLLLLPTVPIKATLLPGEGASREESIERALEMMVNNAPFAVTGHPAMTVPCGVSDGLPVGMMLVGRPWEESTVLRAARAFERART